jgi:hypothetical protein
MGRSRVAGVGNAGHHEDAPNCTTVIWKSRLQAPVVRLGVALTALWIAAATLAVAAQAEPAWSRWSGIWEITLDRQQDGAATCLWSTYDAPPPEHVRRLTFAVNRRGEVVLVVSDRRNPLHLTANSARGLLALGGRIYAIEIGTGIPLTDQPGGMLVGRVVGVDAAGFARTFGQQESGEMRLALLGGWSWSMSLRGTAGVAEGVVSCMAETAAQGGGR